MQTEEEVSIEELNELKLEVEDLLLAMDFKHFLEIQNIFFPLSLNSILVSVTKGWLFEFYRSVEDYDQYDTINKRSFSYKESTWNDSSSFDISYRKERLQRERRVREKIL